MVFRDSAVKSEWSEDKMKTSDVLKTHEVWPSYREGCPSAVTVGFLAQANEPNTTR